MVHQLLYSLNAKLGITQLEPVIPEWVQVCSTQVTFCMCLCVCLCVWVCVSVCVCVCVCVIQNPDRITFTAAPVIYGTCDWLGVCVPLTTNSLWVWLTAGAKDASTSPKVVRMGNHGGQMPADVRKVVQKHEVGIGRRRWRRWRISLQQRKVRRGKSENIYINYYIHCYMTGWPMTTLHLYGTTQTLRIFMIDRQRADLPQSNRSFLKSKDLKL